MPLFAWGRTVHEAAHNAIVLENVAQLAMNTVLLTPNAGPSGLAVSAGPPPTSANTEPDATYGQPELEEQ